MCNGDNSSDDGTKTNDLKLRNSDTAKYNTTNFNTSRFEVIKEVKVEEQVEEVKETIEDKKEVEENISDTDDDIVLELDDEKVENIMGTIVENTVGNSAENTTSIPNIVVNISKEVYIESEKELDKEQDKKIAEEIVTTSLKNETNITLDINNINQATIKKPNKYENFSKAEKFVNVAGLQIAVFINVMYVTLIFFASLNMASDGVFVLLNVLYIAYVCVYIGMSIKWKKFRYFSFVLLSIVIGVLITFFTLLLICGGLLLTAIS